ncbi:hypothetical protein BC830DRAFT_1220581 [Chytriomyces sp. MP71]|nr:hypothetical protein BC830DRAFT_1220581 [Chytriomyces sp. MP71]
MMWCLTAFMDWIFAPAEGRDDEVQGQPAFAVEACLGILDGSNDSFHGLDSGIPSGITLSATALHARDWTTSETYNLALIVTTKSKANTYDDTSANDANTNVLDPFQAQRIYSLSILKGLVSSSPPLDSMGNLRMVPSNSLSLPLLLLGPYHYTLFHRRRWRGRRRLNANVNGDTRNELNLATFIFLLRGSCTGNKNVAEATWNDTFPVRVPCEIGCVSMGLTRQRGATSDRLLSVSVSNKHHKSGMACLRSTISQDYNQSKMYSQSSSSPVPPVEVHVHNDSKFPHCCRYHSVNAVKQSQKSLLAHRTSFDQQLQSSNDATKVTETA